MLSDASSWQLRLQSHFESLAFNARNSGRTIFAIEHALNYSEIEHLQNSARSELASHGLRDDHWLVWVVYATEYGYKYDGIQFWEDFTAHTPAWNHHGSRNKIRDWFHQFQSTFNGIEPRGRWANHFSIISWPITHAILPKDLQRNLARAVYEAQYDLRRVADRPPLEVGWALSRTVYEGSQRFLLFLDQEELVGQIVIALLGNPDESPSLIESNALQRIREDLSAMHDARDWINQAQATWRSHAPQFKVVGSIGYVDNTSSGSEEKYRLLHKVSLTPTVEAQQISESIWQLELTVPLFTEVASINSEFRDFLRSTRVSIPIAETPMLPGEWLLHGVRKRILKTWPPNGEGLLKFENPPPFDGIISWNLALPSHNKLSVFKIESDGTGRLMRGNKLRPDCSYLIAAPIKLSLGALAELCQCECREIFLYRIDLPKLILPEQRTILENLGLEVSKSILLAPAGIPPLIWDEECGGEWLSSNRPMLSIKRDHDFDGYQFRLDEGSLVEIYVNPTAPVLVELPNLPAGKYSLSIQTFSSNNHISVKKLHAEIKFQISIRDPKPWIFGETNYPGMFVSYAPLNPSIDDFLTGYFNLDVLGENDVNSKIEIVLKNSVGEEILRSPILEHALPISHDTWEHFYLPFLKKHSEDSEYFLCNTAYIDITSQEFGVYRISLDRHFYPLRWLLKQKDNISSIYLIEQGSGEDIQASFSEFKSPLTDISIKQEDLQNGIVINDHGGLFRANVGEVFMDVIYAPTDIRGTLTALHVPSCEHSLQDINCYSTLLERASIWNKARTLTYLAKIWQKQLIKTLFDKVICEYCSQRWLKAEHALRESPGDKFVWENLESLVLINQSFGIAVGKTKFFQNPTHEELRARLLEISTRHKIDIDEATFDLAWKLAWFDSQFELLSPEELDILIHYKCVIRAARLMCLRSSYDRLNDSID